VSLDYRKMFFLIIRPRISSWVWIIRGYWWIHIDTSTRSCELLVRVERSVSYHKKLGENC